MCFKQTPVTDALQSPKISTFRAIRLAYENSALLHAGMMPQSSIQATHTSSLGSTRKKIPSSLSMSDKLSQLEPDRNPSQDSSFSNATMFESDEDMFYYNILGLSFDVLLIEYLVSRYGYHLSS